MGMVMVGGLPWARLPHLPTPLLLQRCFQTNGYLSDCRSCSSSYNVAALATSSLVGRWQLLSCPWSLHSPPQAQAGREGWGTELSCSRKACSSVESPFSKCQAPRAGFRGER